MFQLQKSISDVTEEIKDLFDLATLNLTAVDLVSSKRESKLQSNIMQALNNYESFKDIRLKQLIKNQIYLQGDFQRVDRMKDYEDKIQIQRRLISDKQTNYIGLYKKKTLMSLSLSPQDYACVQMNKKKVQRQKYTQSYKNDFITLNKIKSELERDIQNKQKYMSKLNDKKKELQKLKQISSSVIDQHYQYGIFINNQDNNPEIQQYKQQNDQYQMYTQQLTSKYVKKISQLFNSTKQMKSKLAAKQSFTKILLKQNQQLKLKLSKNQKQKKETKQQMNFKINTQFKQNKIY